MNSLQTILNSCLLFPNLFDNFHSPKIFYNSSTYNTSNLTKWLVSWCTARAFLRMCTCRAPAESVGLLPPGNADHKVVPLSPLLDLTHCKRDAGWSVGVPGAICDQTVNFHRLAFNGPAPYFLHGKDVILTNSHGMAVPVYSTPKLSTMFLFHLSHSLSMFGVI